MANIKITDLTVYTDPATTDVVPIVDVGNDTTKKVSVGEVVGKITGDVDVATDGTSSITAGAIVDADVNAAAAIALSKLATGALPTAITVASANIVDGTIVNDDINASAAIAGTKIDPDFGSQTIATTGSITGGTNAAPVILTDTTGVTGADQVTNIMSLTQAEYDAIVSPDANTFYVITA